MNWNYRIMRRYSPEAPETYWYEIIEVFYGEDGIPMLWVPANMPVISDFDIELLDSEQDQELETFVKEGILEQFGMLMRDLDGKGPILDERDFDKGGVYADHPDVVQLRKTAEEFGTDEMIARLKEKLEQEDDDDEDEQI